MRLPVFLAFTVVIIPFNVVDEGDGCISTTIVLLLLLTLVHGFDPSSWLMMLRVRVYLNNRCGFLALQSYESCLVLRRSRLPCVNKRFISGSSWAWWRWWCWGLEGLCVSVCNVLSSLLKAYDEVCVFVCRWRWSSLFSIKFERFPSCFLGCNWNHPSSKTKQD